MTFKEIYDFVNKGGKAVVYTVVENLSKRGEISNSLYMYDYTIRQDVVCSAQMKEPDGWYWVCNVNTSDNSVGLYNDQGNLIASAFASEKRGVYTFFDETSEIHICHVFLTRDDALAELRRLMENEVINRPKPSLVVAY